METQPWYTITMTGEQEYNFFKALIPFYSNSLHPDDRIKNVISDKEITISQTKLGSILYDGQAFVLTENEERKFLTVKLSIPNDYVISKLFTEAWSGKISMTKIQKEPKEEKFFYHGNLKDVWGARSLYFSFKPDNPNDYVD